MSIKKDLIQLCDIQKEVKELRVKIEKMENQIKTSVVDVVKGSSHQFPYELTNFKITGTDLKLQRKLKYTKLKLEEKYEELLERQLKLEEFINDIEDSRIRRIFRFRYIEQYSWVKVARMISAHATADSVRMEHDRFLEKILT